MLTNSCDYNTISYTLLTSGALGGSCTALGFQALVSNTTGQSKIDLSEREHCTPCKASEEDRFGDAAARANSQNLTERGIHKW